ncbi:MAG: MBL fold metallo-hydrolase [Firmicutes bacterium]|nr:MBL fold metallo-hydrolase [Bacillota bacterium]
MTLRFISLASSSRYGNAYLVEGPKETRILIDCGLRIRRMEESLRCLGIDPATIQAVFITHEHIDHTQALKPKTPFPQKYGIPVYASPRLWRKIKGEIGHIDPQLTRVISEDSRESVGELDITSFGKPHDAVEPLGFIVRSRLDQLGVLTDLGNITSQIMSRLKGSEHLIFESNHDLKLERSSGRPWSLIRRVLSDDGHLSNDQAAAALSRLVGVDTRNIALGHLSLDCNTPRLALETVGRALAGTAFEGTLAALPAERSSEWFK